MKKRFKTTVVLRESGVTLTEIALSLPVYLFVIFLFLWAAITWHARVSFTDAVSSAPRLGLTRYSNPVLSDPEKANLLLASPDQQGRDYMSEYDEMTGDMFGLKLDELPPSYKASLIYAYEAIRQAIGQSVRYPCDPSANPPDGGPGCVRCVFLDPAMSGYVRSSLGERSISDLIKLECQYQPSVFLLSSVTNFLRILAGDAAVPKIIFSQRAKFETSLPFGYWDLPNANAEQ